MATSQQSSQQQSNTFFSDPAFVQRLLDSLGPQMTQFNDYLTNPAASPLYTNQLRGLMASLAPQEAQARQAYTDAGTAAGNRSSGAFARGSADLQGNILRNQQATAGQLLGQNFGQMTQALLAAMGLTPQIMNALKLQQSSGSSQGSSESSSGMGGGGGGGGGGYGSGLQGPSYGNYAPGNAITTPGVGAAYGNNNSGFDFGVSAQAPAPVSAPYDPNAWMNGATYFGSNGDFITPGGGWTPSDSEDQWY